MSAAERRLDNLFPRLTARERAVLVLQAYKADATEDPHVRSMPPSQGDEFNRYISLINAVLHVLLPYVLTTASDITTLGLRWQLLQTVLAWGADRALLAGYILDETREPITVSEHAARLQEARSELLELRDAVEIVASGRDEGSRSESAVRAEVKRTIADAVRSVELPASGRGTWLRFTTGDLFDWLGEEVPVMPELGWRLEVVPNEDRERIGPRREQRRFVQQAIASGPHDSDLVFPATGAYRLPDDHLPAIDRAMRAIGERVRSDTMALAGSLSAVRSVLDEARAEFRGEDVAHPYLREELELAQAELDKVHVEAQRLLGEFALPEVDEPRLERLRAAVARYREPR